MGYRKREKKQRERILFVGKSCQQDIAPNDIAVCTYVARQGNLQLHNRLDSGKEMAR